MCRINGLRVLALLLVVGVGGCRQREEGPGPKPASPNAEVLDEMGKAKTWFHAKRVRPIWARKVESDDTVKTIEGTEKVKAGDYVCRGEAGDVWPQTAKRLDEKYEKTAEVDAEGWTKYVPRADNQGVLAAAVPHAFSVRAPWGTLSGKAGDYIVKNFADREVAYPDDVWIVDQKLFHATYQKVEAEW
jgi:hypothetical protein